MHQTARAHLYSALVKVKSIAASTNLPDEIRNGIPKPDISPEEKTILHNVTSQLQGQPTVKKAVDKAIVAVCGALGVPPPSKGKAAREVPVLKELDEGTEADVEDIVEDIVISAEPGLAEEEEEDEVTDFEGFSTDPAPGEEDTELATGQEEDEYSKLNDLLADSDSDDDEVDFSHEKYQRFRGREQVNLDDISVSGSDGEAEITSGSESDVNTDSESEGEQPPPPPRLSLSLSPPPKPPKAKKVAKITGRAGESAFLPTLMGGYVSGSESASSIDVAPRKKRLGQQQRQAIAEKKYGAKAKHLARVARGRNQGGRDSGWDMRRGAVEGGDTSSRTPWKKGISNPLIGTGANSSEIGPRNAVLSKPRVERKKDDQGPIHASWEAAKKARDKEKKAEFSGTKITFD